MSEVFIRDYQILTNGTYTVHDVVEVISAWQLEQSIKFTDSQGALTWLTTKIEFDGDKWEQNILWNGIGVKTVTNKNDEKFMTDKVVWPEQNPTFSMT